MIGSMLDEFETGEKVKGMQPPAGALAIDAVGAATFTNPVFTKVLVQPALFVMVSVTV